jgi:hypothetical protein
MGREDRLRIRVAAEGVLSRQSEVITVDALSEEAPVVRRGVRLDTDASAECFARVCCTIADGGPLKMRRGRRGGASHSPASEALLAAEDRTICE